MKYCWYCKRINPGEPVYCQFCASTFSIRVCSRCRHQNPKEALACGNCGNPELSEIAGPVPLWLKILRIFIKSFTLSVKLFSGMLVLFCYFAPEKMAKFTRPFSDFIKQRVFNNKERS